VKIPQSLKLHIHGGLFIRTFSHYTSPNLPLYLGYNHLFRIFFFKKKKLKKNRGVAKPPPWPKWSLDSIPLKLHSKKRWSLDSIPLRQKGHRQSPTYPQPRIRLLVIIASLKTSHNRKACL
jgi:hypothetical protein